MERSWLSAPKERAGRRARLNVEALELRDVPALAVTPLGGAVTPTTLANSLAGAGVVISNVTYVGDNAAAGLVTGGADVIGIPDSIVLSTGTAADVVGPNVSDGVTTSLGLPGDADLDAITSPETTNDATVLEFDFVPQGSTLTFSYVFSSEEYNEFVGQFNDAFAFILNGQNVALIPGTTQAVSINNVNNGVNSQYYINNALATDPEPGSPPLRNTEMDGLTVVLEVTAAVNPGQVNHIKLAIADTFDDRLDSNVFIAQGSFSAPVYTAFRPVRYAFRSLEQNQGNFGATPAGGTADEETYDGLVTIINTGTIAGTGPLRVTFRDLPTGVEVVNPDGYFDDAGTLRPYVNIPVDVVEVGTPIRLAVKVRNPLSNPMGTYFLGRYNLDVSDAA